MFVLFEKVRLIPAAIALLAISQFSLADKHDIVKPSHSDILPESCQNFTSPENSASHLRDNSCSENQTFVTTAVLSAGALFGFDSNELSAGGLNALNKLMDDLTAFREIQVIRIVGHTDSSGPAVYNQYLSDLRAGYIGGLFSSAFPAVVVTSLGKGEAEPIADNKSRAGRNKNRRVEIEVIALK